MKEITKWVISGLVVLMFVALIILGIYFPVIQYIFYTILALIVLAGLTYGIKTLLDIREEEKGQK